MLAASFWQLGHTGHPQMWMQTLTSQVEVAPRRRRSECSETLFHTEGLSVALYTPSGEGKRSLAARGRLGAQPGSSVTCSCGWDI